jgi:hypothetical protein
MEDGGAIVKKKWQATGEKCQVRVRPYGPAAGDRFKKPSADSTDFTDSKKIIGVNRRNLRIHSVPFVVGKSLYEVVKEPRAVSMDY